MQAEAQAIAAVERQKHEAAITLQRMQEEAASHELRLNAMRLETERKLQLAEQALSRQASTAASVGSAAEASAQPSGQGPEVTYKARHVFKGDQVRDVPLPELNDPELNNLENNSRNMFLQMGKLTPDFFQNLFMQPQSLPNYFMPGTQTQVLQPQTEVELVGGTCNIKYQNHY